MTTVFLGLPVWGWIVLYLIALVLGLAFWRGRTDDHTE